MTSGRKSTLASFTPQSIVFTPAGSFSRSKEEIYNAMLVPGEYKEKDGKFYIKRGMLDGYIA